MAEPLKKPEPTLYDRDFYAWTQEQGAKLRAGSFQTLDFENLIDEVEALGRSVKREIESRLRVLLLHLLKWRYQASERSSSWRGSIVEQRRRLLRELAENPSLASYPQTVLAEEYESARLKAAGETGLPEEAFPLECPFAMDELLDPDFLPDAGG